MRSRPDDGANLARRTLLAMAAMAPALAADITNAAEPAPTPIAELPPDLAKTIKEYDEATVSNDVAMLGNIVADDYVLVNSDSTVQDKHSYLTDFTVPGFRLDPYVMKEPVQKIWGNTALTAGRLHLAWSQNGKRQNREVRIAHVWIKNDDRWRLAYTQLTRVI
jgi:ketosteroid isomerase-like protein